MISMDSYAANKNLIGIPWRVALALQEDGWILRSDIIWAKGSCLPESVADRSTKSHEYLFLLTKSTKYFYDSEAIREKTTTVGTRNKRSVWKINPQPYKGAHFATFPRKLVEPPILAGTSERGCCSACGAPYRRIVERGEPLREHQLACGSNVNGEYTGNARKDYSAAKAQNASATKARILAGMRKRTTVGWRRTCKCESQQIVPCTVLDPFCGSGTTGVVSVLHNRYFIGIELHPEYAKMATDRIMDELRDLPQSLDMLFDDGEYREA